MATGASTADVAILLVDARHGILEQSRRHARIARLLGIRDFVLAVNKMDLVDFDRDVFEGIASEFSTLLAGASLYPIPVSALHGDNVITRSAAHAVVRRPEPARVPRDGRRRVASAALGPLRFPVQLVIRPDQDFRGYAGQILSGTVRVGDTDHRLAVGPHRAASSASSPGTATSTSPSRRCR